MTFPGTDPERVLVEYAPVLHTAFDLKPVVPPVTIAFVQANGANNTNVPTLPVTLTSNVAAGNLMVVAVGAANLAGAAATMTVTDSLGNTYTQIGTVVSDPGNYGLCLWWSHLTTGGSDTVTFHTGAGDLTFIRIIANEFSGVTVLDQHSSGSGASYPLSSGNMTTTAANEVVFGWGAANNNAATPGTGFTIAFTVTGQSTEYDIVSAAGTYAAVFPGDGASSNWACAGATFQ